MRENVVNKLSVNKLQESRRSTDGVMHKTTLDNDTQNIRCLNKNTQRV